MEHRSLLRGLSAPAGLEREAAADDGALPLRLVGRLAAALFVLSGLVTLLSPLLPEPPGMNSAGVMLVGAVAMMLGAVVWFLPWERWPRATGLVFVPLAFTLIGFHNHFGGDDPYRYGLFFIVVFMWIGVSQPRWTSLWFVPPLTVAYLVPLYTSGHFTAAASASAVYTIPVCLLVAETIGWVSQRLREAQLSRRESDTRYRALVEQTPGAIYLDDLDNDGRTAYISPQVLSIAGYTPDEWRANSNMWAQVIHPEDRERVEGVVRRPDDAWKLEYRLLTKERRVVWVRDEAIIVRDAAGRPRFRQGLLLDITAQKALEARIVHQAYHDALTGLPNRALFLDRLEHALKRRRRPMVAVLFLDVDNFKIINDSLGHDIGDQFLVAVTERLRGCLRDEDTVARFGGDEFTILLEDIADANEAIVIADRLIAAMTRPFNLGSHAVAATTSVGIAINTEAAVQQPRDMLRAADVALYRAKRMGKCCHALFEADMDAEAIDRLALEHDLRHALERGEFEIYYQPVVDLATGAVCEIEALLRWNHPTRGLIGPVEFIPIAEDSGLIGQIGSWVLTEACRQALVWQVERSIVLSVNLSARQFRHPALVDEIARVLRETGFDPRYLKLELTESVMMEDGNATIGMLQQLKALGIRLAIDDFGTGYSSLSYLKRFPIDTLKIDRSFVRGLVDNSEDQALVLAVISAAEALRLSVTSEGIETAEQAARLRDFGCARGQGFLFAEPSPYAVMNAFLRGVPLLTEAPRASLAA